MTHEALQHGLVFPDWKRYDVIKAGHNGIRFGFASHNEQEMRELIKRLAVVMQQIRPHAAILPQGRVV